MPVAVVKLAWPAISVPWFHVIRPAQLVEKRGDRGAHLLRHSLLLGPLEMQEQHEPGGALDSARKFDLSCFLLLGFQSKHLAMAASAYCQRVLYRPATLGLRVR
jgi:hypothetical protein